MFKLLTLMIINLIYIYKKTFSIKNLTNGCLVIQVSDNVFKKLASMRNSNDNKELILRISVESGGCSGFQYKYELTNAINLKQDYIIENNSIKIVVDDISLGFMKGCHVDYIEELGSSEFLISNPNISSKCGCNNSFSV